MTRQSHTRIQAALTGRQGRALGPAEAHEKTVLAVTRRIHTLERRRRELRAQLEAANKELKFKRRELRALLQRDTSMGLEDRLAAAGQADAIDAAEARRER